MPNTYAIEAMRSGQLTILNKLGIIISTKYPTITNPFEDEVEYAKRVLTGAVEDDKTFHYYMSRIIKRHGLQMMEY